jgi:HlyD family secretion protein
MLPASWRLRLLLGIVVVGVVALAGARAWSGSGAPDPSIQTAEVTRGDYTDVVEIRGEVRPVRSTLINAPSNAGELLIVKLVRNGSTVKKGDTVAEFDAVALKRTIQEKQGELRSARAQQEQSKAQASINIEEKHTAVVKAEYDVMRAQLALGDVELVSKADAERARLTLADAEQRLLEAKTGEASTRSSAAADAVTSQRAIEKIQADLDRAQRAVGALSVTAPADGVVNILPNYRSSSPMGVAQEFRTGDRSYPGATILELPDLSSVFLVARIDEADRGQLKQGQSASIRLDAIPDRDYQAKVSEIALLARIDFTSGWPPTKQFDLKLSFSDPDDRLHPGMSAAARISTGRLADVLLVPADALQTLDGRDVVYRQKRGGFEAVPVEVLRRGREQAAIRGGVGAGDKVALTRPDATPGAGGT